MLLEIAASIFCYDIWFYISHRMLHTRLLWAFHAQHHEKREPTFWDAYYSHWFEAAFQSIGTFVPYLFISYGWLETVLILAFLNIRGMLRHESRLTGWWSGIRHHIGHHQHPMYNYGEEWLDVLCGTMYMGDGGCWEGCWEGGMYGICGVVCGVVYYSYIWMCM